MTLFGASILSDPLVTTIAGAALGMLVKSIIDYTKQQRMATESARRQFLQQQLSEFYSPLHARLIHDEAIWKLRTSSDELSDEKREEIQRAIEEQILLPNHEAMAELIATRFHLAGYEEVPECFEKYLQHVAAFRGLRATGRLEPPSKIGAPFPVEFAKEVHTRTAKITKEYAVMLEIELKRKKR